MAGYLAAHAEAKLLILETPFSSMKDLFYAYYPCSPKVFLFRFSFPTHKYIARVSYPILILQGTDDWVVPLKCAEKLKPHLKKSDRFLVIKGGTHNDLAVFDSYQKEIDKWL